jgi:hypothetical protein
MPGDGRKIMDRRSLEAMAIFDSLIKQGARPEIAPPYLGGEPIRAGVVNWVLDSTQVEVVLGVDLPACQPTCEYPPLMII